MYKRYNREGGLKYMNDRNCLLIIYSLITFINYILMKGHFSVEKDLSFIQTYLKTLCEECKSVNQYRIYISRSINDTYQPSTHWIHISRLIYSTKLIQTILDSYLKVNKSYRTNLDYLGSIPQEVNLLYKLTQTIWDLYLKVNKCY